MGDAVETFLARYANQVSRRCAAQQLSSLIAHTGASDLCDFSERTVHAWITSPGANNTVRQRLSIARTFFGWCLRRRVIATDPTRELDYLTKQYPKTYGKVQDSRPARWLTADEASRLVRACQDATPCGLRDEIVIRLGLAGMRAAEIRELRVGDVRDDAVQWIGKGRKPRHIVPGRLLLDAVHAYLATWADETAGPAPDDHLLVPTMGGGCSQRYLAEPVHHATRMRWGTPVGYHLVGEVVRRRALSAGIGHVAPHDLRRTAAGLLHHATSADGGHLFDLLDIQKVLGHADPTTTMRSYLDPMDTGVQRRASLVLDVG